MEKYIIEEENNDISLLIYVPNFIKEDYSSKIINELENINDWKVGKSIDGSIIKRKQRWYQKDNQPFCKTWKKNMIDGILIIIQQF